MAGAVMLAAWIPRHVVMMAPRRAALVVAALGVVFLTGGASVTHWARTRAPAVIAASDPGAAMPQPLAPVPEIVPGDVAKPVAEPEAPPPEAAVSPAGGPDGQEIERRRAAAARLRKLIEAGPDATEPAIAGGLLAEADPQPIYENGELLGIELQNVRPDGFYARLGLREGDLVQSINGAPLDASGKLLREIASSPEIHLLVERSNGRQERITVLRQQILEGLQALE
jgi:hypothetical protein